MNSPQGWRMRTLVWQPLEGNTVKAWTGGGTVTVTGAGPALGEEDLGSRAGPGGGQEEESPDHQHAVGATSDAGESPVTQSPEADCVKEKTKPNAEAWAFRQPCRPCHHPGPSHHCLPGHPQCFQPASPLSSAHFFHVAARGIKYVTPTKSLHLFRPSRDCPSHLG